MLLAQEYKEVEECSELFCERDTYRSIFSSGYSVGVIGLSLIAISFALCPTNARSELA